MSTGCRPLGKDCFVVSDSSWLNEDADAGVGSTFMELCFNFQLKHHTCLRVNALMIFKMSSVGGISKDIFMEMCHLNPFQTWNM